jgi:hypothetical protein
MKEPHFLRASSNSRRLIENVRHLVSDKSLTALEDALNQNAKELYDLALNHMELVEEVSPDAWRHVVSRLYYAAYNAVRGVRLCCDGHYSQDARDHHRFDSLPSDFPSKERYTNLLPLLRDDRNLCDYDHTADLQDLTDSLEGWTAVVGQLLEDAKIYLKGRGVEI